MVCLAFLIFALVFSGCTKDSNIPGNGDNNSGGTIPVEGIELVSGAPVSAVMEGGLAPLSFDKVISNAVMGAVYISSEKFPDLFVSCPTGISGGMRGTPRISGMVNGPEYCVLDAVGTRKHGGGIIKIDHESSSVTLLVAIHILILNLRVSYAII